MRFNRTEHRSIVRKGSKFTKDAVEPTQNSATRLAHLDMLRGAAAIAVVLGHVRGFVLTDYGELASPSLADKTLYTLAGFGHQSVIAFFALSGYLVGGQASRRMMSGAWSFPEFIVARLARLWTVVIPALALTLALDVVGRALGGGSGYDGAWRDALSSGPKPNDPADHSLQTFLANVFFLQTVSAPVFGTNGPLWSLANEFWYYVMFPLATAALLMRWSAARRVAAAAAAATIAWLLPPSLVALGGIWIWGALASHATDLTRGRIIVAHPLYLFAAASVVGVTTVVDRQYGGTTADLLLGGSWAALLPALALLAPVGRSYERVARGLSEISYTLYATHFPFLALVWFAFLAPQQFSPAPASIALAIALVAASLGVATFMWWCFERNTPHVRAIAAQLLLRPSPGATTPPAEAARPGQET